MIKDPKGKMIATIPNTDGLYKIAATMQSNKSQMANAASAKMLISEAHKKLRHVSCSAIKHVVLC